MEERKRIRLTKYSTEAGWTSKFPTGDLGQALEWLAPGVLGGFAGGMETRDDAGYVPFGGSLFLQTADLIVPVVDDPYRFGPFAAAVVGGVVDGDGVRVMA